ncbi:MAG TPA: hypothetical protein VFF04_01340, partial [Candidatus Babeliales bacterium]|nr:hypothetical protein [Candidatus Babeliales bacterium]
MNSARRLQIGIATVFAGLFIATGVMYAKNTTIIYVNEAADFQAILEGKFKPEFFWAKNINLLNNCNPFDRVVYARHTFDVGGNLTWGKIAFGDDILEMQGFMRNKAIWGSPTSIAKTTDATVKLSESVTGRHRHDIPRQIFWLRELWLRFVLNQPLGLGFHHYHDITLGAFPFELGRGIALGSAYAVGPERLGFYSDSSIDQYAFGAKVYGDILEQQLAYELYAAILQNKSTSISETAANILGQQYGHFDFPERGFGKINFIIAGRMFWTAFDNALGKLSFEPYVLYNQDPEQTVEFLADASSKLGTVGMAGEYYGDRFEFGFDYAINIGHQNVKGWDRDDIIGPKNQNGFWRELHSHVVDQNGNRIPFVPRGSAESIIDNAVESEAMNGQQIGVIEADFCNACTTDLEPVELINAQNRFRDPYCNTFKGWMFVADAGQWIHNHEVMLALTAGIATGDENPHVDTKNKTYDGFVPLQEIYSGKRVRSAFLMGGVGRIKRPLSEPSTDQAPSRFASEVNGFSNLVFTGAAAVWKPKGCGRDFMINPNIIAYWEEAPTHAFDIKTKHDSPRFARPFLGVELNTFGYVQLLKDLKFYGVWSIFIPGGFYTDNRGRPFNND